MLVTLVDIPVMFVVSPRGPQGAGEAFDRLEARLPSLKGRKFYGTLVNGEYRACVALEAQDSPAAMGLDTWIIPGGVYARRKLPLAGQCLRVPVPARSACGGPRYGLSSAHVWSR